MGNEYTSSQTAAFNADSTGQYNILVKVKDSKGTIAEKQFDYAIYDKMTNNSTISESEIYKGESLTMNAEVTGGIGSKKYTYYYKLKDEASWTAIGTENTTTASAKFTPETAGNYEIKIKAVDSNNSTAEKTFNVTVAEILTNESTVNKETAYLEDNISIQGAANGGFGNYSYSYYYKLKSASSWTLIGSEYTLSQTASFNANTVGQYYILIKVKDSKDKIVEKQLSVTVSDKLTNNSSISKDEIYKGDSVVIRAAVSGGIGSKKYTYNYKLKGDSDWTLIGTENTTTANVTFKPQAAGSYEIMVKAVDSENTSAEKTLNLTVFDTLQNESYLSSSIAYMGDSILINGAASGGTGGYTYSYSYKQKTAKTWTPIVDDYTSSQTASLKPAAAGQYIILVRVKDSYGKTADKQLAYTVYDLISNNSTVSKTHLYIGESVTIKVATTGGTVSKKYTYSYRQKGTSSWTIIGTENTTTTSASLVLKEVGSYEIMVKAVDDNNVVSEKIIDIFMAEKFVNESSLDKTVSYIGDSITINGAASGGFSSYTYAYYYKVKNASSWTPIGEEYTTAQTASINTDTTGQYQVLVKVKDSNEKIEEKQLSYTVYDKLLNDSTISKTKLYLGDSLSMKAVSSGGMGSKKYTYCYKLKTDLSWTTIGKENTTATSVTVAPPASGNYEFMIEAKDLNNETVQKIYDVIVSENLVNESTLNKEKIGQGESMVITGLASGGAGQYKYAYFYKQKYESEWTAISSEFTTDNTATFNGISVGTYDILVKVKDAWETIAEKQLDFEVCGDLANNSYLTKTELYTNESISIVGVALGGSGDYKYAFYYRRKGTDTWIKKGTEFSTSSKSSFSTSTPGEYEFLVKVKDSNDDVVEKEMSAIIKQALLNKSSVNKTTTYTGDKIIITGGAEGGAGDYKYAFYYKKTGVSNYTLKGTEFGSDTAVTLYPAIAAKYTILVKVTDSSGKIVQKTFNVNVKEGLKNNSSIDKKTVSKGSKVTITGDASGGEGEYKYAFYFRRKGQTTWILKGTEFGDDTTVYLYPATISKYEIMVKVKDKNDNIASKTISLDVTSPEFVNNSTISTTSLYTNEKLTVNGAASGGAGDFKYAFYFRRQGDTDWTLKGTEYGSDTSVNLYPATATIYEIMVNVKDSSGKVVSKTMTVDVMARFSNKSTVSQTVAKVGDKIDIIGAAIGGEGEYQYAIYYKHHQNYSWILKGTKYGSENSAVLTPKYADQYDIKVNIKDSTGKVVTKTFIIDVTE